MQEEQRAVLPVVLEAVLFICSNFLIAVHCEEAMPELLCLLEKQCAVDSARRITKCRYQSPGGHHSRVSGVPAPGERLAGVLGNTV